MKLTKGKTEIRSLKQEIIAKAQKSSELSRKIRYAKSASEVRQLSEELKRVVDEMEPAVATLAAYRRQKRVESAKAVNMDKESE